MATALKTELDQGYIIGPFFNPPFDNYRVSPLGVAMGSIQGKNDLFWIYHHLMGWTLYIV